MYESIRSQLQHRIAVAGHTPEIDDELAMLAEREARLTAADTDDETLRTVADAELTDVQARREQRQQLRVERFGTKRQQASLYVEHDGTVDAVAAVAADIRSWSALGAHPGLTAIADGLDAIAVRSRNQRGKPPAERTDDLDADTTAVADALLHLRGVLDDVARQRGTAVTQLDSANQGLVDANNDAPPA